MRSVGWLTALVVLAAAPLLVGPEAAGIAGGLVIVVVTLTILTRVIGHRDHTSPTLMIPVTLLGYFTIGSLVPLRGYVTPAIAGVVALGLAGYFLGVCLTGLLSGQSLLTWPRLKDQNAPSVQTVRIRLNLILLVCLGISALATLMIIRSTGGAPLARLGRRHELSGYLFILAELGWVAAMWWNFDQWTRLGRLSWRGIALLLAVALLLALLAFRTPLLTMILVMILGYHRLVRPIRAHHLLVAFLVMLIFAWGYGWLRLQGSDRYGGYSQFLALTGAKWGPLESFAPVATTVHEGPLVLTLLMENIPNRYNYQMGAVTFSTLTTLLPGYQIGPRGWIGIYARGLEHSTTPTILGFPYVDFGYPGVFVFMGLFGMGIAWLYLMAARRPTLLWVWLWAYFQTALLLSIHTGFADTRHLVLTVFALLIAWGSSRHPFAYLRPRHLTGAET
jgi:Putative O-antigen polymerase